MKSLLLTKTIAAPPDRVWDVVTDVHGWADRIEGIQKIEVLSNDEFGVGLRWRETRVMFGKEAVEEMGISKCEPKRSYTVTGESCGTRFDTELRLIPDGAGTRLEQEMAWIPQTLFAKIMGGAMGWMMKGAMTKALNADLDDIQRACENR